MIFDVLEVSGLSSSILGMRYPTKSTAKNDSIESATRGFVLGAADARLAASLINRGQEHAKFQRGIVAWFHINMPRYAWQEIDTYTVGMIPVSSESTMYTLKREIRNGSLTPEAFAPETDQSVIEACQMVVSHLISKYGDIDAIPYDILKGVIPESFMQARVRAYTYQTLARMYQQRHDHRLPFWKDVVCPTIEDLPYADVLIFGRELE